FDERADGVIAFDQEAFQALLELAGPVEVPDLGEHGETITAENYRARALYWLYQSESASGEREWLPGTKTSFVGKLSAAMLKRLLQLGPADLLRFAPTLQRLFAEKHMLVSLHGERAARLLATHGWDGRLDH